MNYEISDDDREDMIDVLRLQYIGEKDIAKQHVIWNQLRVLINGRSPARVGQMEREKGLRA